MKDSNIELSETDFFVILQYMKANQKQHGYVGPVIIAPSVLINLHLCSSQNIARTAIKKAMRSNQ